MTVGQAGADCSPALEAAEPSPHQSLASADLQFELAFQATHLDQALKVSEGVGLHPLQLETEQPFPRHSLLEVENSIPTVL